MAKQIEVVGAAILDSEKIFAVQRSDKMTLSNYWEFPGGKVEKNEDEEEAIIREIKEELNVGIKVIDYIGSAEYNYDFGTVRMHLYTARITNGKLTLNEHKDSRWLKASQLTEVNWAPVDIPLAKVLKKKLV